MVCPRGGREDVGLPGSGAETTQARPVSRLSGLVLNAGERLTKQCSRGCWRKARVDPAITVWQSLLLSPRARAPEREALSCSNASRAGPGRARQAGVQRWTRHGQAVSSGGPATATPSSWAQASGPQARRLASTRSSGTELQSHLVSQSAPRSLRSRRPSPSSRPSARGSGAAAGGAEAPRTRLLHDDGPQTDAGVGRPGPGPRSLSRSKSRQKKLHKAVKEGERESSSGVGGEVARGKLA